MTDALRIRVGSTRESFLIEDGQVYGDLDGDGRIGRHERLERDPAGTTLSALQAAARHFADYYTDPIPGTKSPDPNLTSGGRLNQPERLAFERGSAGVAAKRKDVWSHLDYFDAQSRDGKVGLAESFAAWRALGFGALRSVIGAGASGVLFGSLRQGLSIDVEAIQARRPKRSTAVYDRQTGDVDPARLQVFLAEFDRKGGTLTHAELERLLASQAELGFVPKNQFKSLFQLTERMNGDKTVTRAQFEGLYDGSLLYRAAELHRARG